MKITENKTEGFFHFENHSEENTFPLLILDVKDQRPGDNNLAFKIMHWHSDLQFVYVTDGSIELHTLGSDLVIPSGEGAFINKNVPHLIDPKSSRHYVSIRFPEYFISFYPGSPAEQSVRRITEREDILLIPIHRDTSWGTSILAHLSNLASPKTDAPNYHYAVLLSLCEIWMLLFDNLNNTSTNPLNAETVRLRKFLNFIEDNYSEDFSLEDLSKSANVSKSECLRCFRHLLDTTPWHYLMNYRISRAASMLKETLLPISELAFRCGFNSQCYFSKCFHDKIGYTPLQYRRMFR